VRPRETLPDRVLLAADDVVIVDLTPPALIERLRALRIYPPERV
jgi:two-component system sensor histidine kinase KdpD